jgi:murein DD-endopeptidase MepM/ murein hydrolase activator NlpD
MDGRWGDISSAFREGYNSTVSVKQQENSISAAETRKKIADLRALKEFFSPVDTVSEFKNNYDFDKEPGDKYKDETTKDKFDKLAAKYERKLDLIRAEQEFVQAQIDKAEARGETAAATYYERLIELEDEEKSVLLEKQQALSNYLNQHGAKMTKEEWAEANNEINETAQAIEECTQNMIEFAQAIDDIHWEYADRIKTDLDEVAEEAAWVRSLFEDEEVADENGNWSAAGITQVGLSMSEMEIHAANAEQAKENIDRVKNSWQEYQALLAKHNGNADAISSEETQAIIDKYGILITSEEEYQDKTIELNGVLRDSIDGYEDSKDVILDLAKARVEAIKEGIDKEIDAYNELIDVKKEELEAERDLYEFKKNIEDKTSNISELERRIASLSGSTDAGDIAERRKLEAELRDAQSELDDEYYSHSKDQQMDALDDEAEAFEKSKQKYMEQLDEMLKNTAVLIQNACADALRNADIVLGQLNEKGSTYGITFSDTLTQPWKDAAEQATTWKSELEASMTSGEFAALIGEGGAITAFSNGIADKLKGAWTKAKTAASGYIGYINNQDVKTKHSNFCTSIKNYIQGIIDKWKDVKAAAEAAANVKYTPPVNPVQPTNDPGATDDPELPDDPDPPEVKQKMQHVGTTVKQIILGSDDYVKKNTKTINGKKYFKSSSDGDLGGHYISLDDLKWITYDGGRSKGWAVPAKTAMWRQYAKGTLGTKKDELAITDESWIGEEITLGAGKSGRLQYLRKGSAVLPADISSNLMEWGQLSPNDISGTGVSHNVNVANNYISPNVSKITADTIDDIITNATSAIKDLTQKVETFTTRGIDEPVIDTKQLIDENIEDIIKNSTSVIKDLTKKVENFTTDGIDEPVQNTNQLINKVIDDTVINAVDALNDVYNKATTAKPLLDNSLIAPWLSAIEKTKNFKDSANNNYKSIIDYVGLNNENLTNALTAAFKKAIGDKSGSGVLGFKTKGTQAVDAVSNKFNAESNGLIAIVTKTKEIVNKLTTAFKDLSEFVTFKDQGGGSASSLGSAVVPSTTGVTSPYGYRTHPIKGVRHFHSGIDYGAPYGTPINAYAAGTVVRAQHTDAGGYGIHAMIDHGNGYATLYGHASKLLVKQGQKVSAGEQIAKVGSTGTSTGNHLHFEARQNGKAINPLSLPAPQSSSSVQGLIEQLEDVFDNRYDIAPKKANITPGQYYLSDFDKNITLSENVTRWSDIAAEALHKTGQYSHDNLILLLYQMQTESSGNPRAINNWDINAKNGVPSKGLMQVIDPTFKAYAMDGYNTDIYDPLSNIIASIRYTVSRYGSLRNGWRGHGYAKGTLGTKEDEIAVVDEFGPELIMHADPTTGRLQYLTKGSSVIPSDITSELMALGKVGLDGLMNTNKFGANVNMINSAVNKPELNLSFENLLHIDNCSQDSMDEVKKFVSKEMDTFARKLNYAVRRVGGK